MPPPKRRHSSERRDKRRTHDHAHRVDIATCPECGAPIEPHRACPKCGTFGKARNLVRPLHPAKKKE